MTRDEAQKALDEGKRITHPKHSGTVFALALNQFDESMIVSFTSEGRCTVISDDPELPYRDGWELYEPEAEKPKREVRCERCAFHDPEGDDNDVMCHGSYDGHIPPHTPRFWWCHSFWPADPAEWRCETCRAWTHTCDITSNGTCEAHPEPVAKLSTERCGQWKCRIPERGDVSDPAG